MQKELNLNHFGANFAIKHFSNFVIKNSKNHVFKNAPKVIEIVSKKLNFHQNRSKIIPAHQLQLRYRCKERDSQAILASRNDLDESLDLSHILKLVGSELV